MDIEEAKKEAPHTLTITITPPNQELPSSSHPI